MHTFKRLQDMAAAYFLSRRLERHNHWPREKLLSYQAEKVAKLVRHAARHSAFYARQFENIDLSGPVELSALPVVDKHLLMENFDAAVTDPRLKLADIRSHLETLSGDDFYLGTYRVVATAGTSGYRGYFVYDRPAWRVVLANTLRWNGFLGIQPRFPRRIRIASIGADNPMHVTERIPRSGDTGLFRVEHFLATEPIATIARGLQAFRPDVILSYPSIAALLAIEQIEGRMQISPRVVSTHSELLTQSMRERIRSAWGLDSFNHYGLTEEPHVAADCSRHEGLHIFEDTSVVEVVDADSQPVLDGRPGAKYLLTNLYNFAQPLIRYEVSDVLTRAPVACSCGRPFSLISQIGGRSDDVLYLKAKRGGEPIPIVPLSVEMCIEAFQEVEEYAVQHMPDLIDVRIVPRGSIDEDIFRAALTRDLTRMMDDAGADPPEIRVELVEKLARQRERMGKHRLVAAAASSLDRKNASETNERTRQ